MSVARRTIHVPDAVARFRPESGTSCASRPDTYDPEISRLGLCILGMPDFKRSRNCSVVSLCCTGALGPGKLLDSGTVSVGTCCFVSGAIAAGANDSVRGSGATASESGNGSKAMGEEGNNSDTMGLWDRGDT